MPKHQIVSDVGPLDYNAGSRHIPIRPSYMIQTRCVSKDALSQQPRSERQRNRDGLEWHQSDHPEARLWAFAWGRLWAFLWAKRFFFEWAFWKSDMFLVRFVFMNLFFELFQKCISCLSKQKLIQNTVSGTNNLNTLTVLTPRYIFSNWNLNSLTPRKIIAS